MMGASWRVSLTTSNVFNHPNISQKLTTKLRSQNATTACHNSAVPNRKHSSGQITTLTWLAHSTNLSIPVCEEKHWDAETNFDNIGTNMHILFSKQHTCIKKQNNLNCKMTKCAGKQQEWIDCKNGATLKIWNDNVNSGSALATNMHRKRAISTAKWQNAWDDNNKMRARSTCITQNLDWMQTRINFWCCQKRQKRDVATLCTNTRVQH